MRKHLGYRRASHLQLYTTIIVLFIRSQGIIRVLGVLVFLSLLYSTLICFIPETGWYSDVYAWAYQDLIEMVEFWT